MKAGSRSTSSNAVREQAPPAAHPASPSCLIPNGPQFADANADGNPRRLGGLAQGPCTCSQAGVSLRGSDRLFLERTRRGVFPSGRRCGLGR